MTNASWRTVSVTLAAGAFSGFLIGWTIPFVVDWFPMSSPIRGEIDACFVGIEKKAYKTVSLFDSDASPDNGIVYAWVCFAIIGALVALAGLLVFHIYKTTRKR